MNRAFVILCEGDAQAGVNFLEVRVGLEPIQASIRHLLGIGLRLRANCLILGKVVHE